jgi:8-oxo-dGTP pyrophosphatase MutT (NUDIX family)
MNAGSIRAIAICVFRNGGRILAGEGYDSRKNQTFYRPLGGAIEFGEQSPDTIIRELREEIGAEVANLRYLGTLENIFTFEGEAGHEIVQVFDGDLVDTSLYEREAIDGSEDAPTGPLPFKAVWMPLAHFAEGRAPLYPHGLLELLARA